MKKIHTQVSYKTTTTLVKVMISYISISIEIVPHNEETIQRLIETKKIEKSKDKKLWYWDEKDKQIKKEIAGIKYGLHNLFHKRTNLIAIQQEKFVNKTLELKDYTVHVANVDGGITIEQVKEFYKVKKEKITLLKAKKEQLKQKESEDLRKKDQTLFPRYKEEYSAEVWKAISQEAFEKRKNYYNNLRNNLKN